MAIGFAIPPPPAMAPLQPSPTVSKTARLSSPTSSSSSPPLECTCGARAYLDKQAQERSRLLKRVAPVGGVAGVMVMRAIEHEDATREKRALSQPEDDDHAAMPARKRSLWRKILGKGPKCICAPRPKAPTLAIPSDYVGCSTVRVAGKRVAYTRDMQLLKRRAYTPMDAIAEDEE